MTQEILARAAKEYGTPLYLFDLDALKQGTEEIKDVLGEEISLCFAMKANPFLTDRMAEMVSKIEVCSPGELQICLAKKIPMSRIIFSGVLKDEQDLELLFGGAKLPVFTAESEAQVKQLCEMAEKHGRRAEVLLRLTSGNQFGMDRETLLTAAKVLSVHPFVKMKGIHFYSGTQKRKAGQIQKELLLLDEVCLEVCEKTGMPVEHLEYGPGFGIEYFKTAKQWGKEDAVALLKAAGDCAKELKFGGAVAFEMGRFLTAMYGYFVTCVREVKRNEDKDYCLVDGGMHHINYDGQVMAMKTPYCTQIPSREAAGEKSYTICGALCSANDILIRQYPLREIKPGDLLVFERVGAYAMTEGMSLFLSRDLPAVVCYSEKDGYTVLRKCTPGYPLNM